MAQDEGAIIRDTLLGLDRNQSVELQSGDLLKTLQQRGLIEIRQHVGLGQTVTQAPGTGGDLLSNLPNASLASLGSARRTVLAVDSALRQVNDALVSQFARTRCAQRFDLIVHPVNANERSLERLIDCWRLSQKQTIGRLILQDLEVVGPGLDDVPIDDLLSFRERYGSEHREYMRELRRFVTDISQLTDEEQENEVYYRRDELTKRARSLSQISRSAWKSGARFLLGITGASLTMAAGNVPGAAVSTASAFLGLGGGQEKGDAFTYLCHVAKL